MERWFVLGIYVVGYLVCARILWVTMPARERENDGPFAPVVISLIWPIIAVVALAALPLLGAGWLISLPTRGERREARRQRVEERAAETAELAARYDLPAPKES